MYGLWGSQLVFTSLIMVLGMFLIPSSLMRIAGYFYLISGMRPGKRLTMSITGELTSISVVLRSSG